MHGYGQIFSCRSQMLIYIIYKYLHMCSVTMCARLFPDWLALFLVKCNICPCLRQGQKLAKLSVGKWEPHKHVSFFWLFAYCAVNYEMILPSECVHWPCHLGDTHSTGGALNGRMILGRGSVSFKIMQFWLLPPANCIWLLAGCCIINMWPVSRQKTLTSSPTGPQK